MKSCSHCHLKYEKSALFKKVINGKVEYFCCRGCEGVFTLLGECNLGEFYNKIGATTLTPPKEPLNDDLAKFDSESYAKKYIKILGRKDSRSDSHKNSQDSHESKPDSHNKSQPQLCEVSLIIEGIHCIACVWLNQKILNATQGIISADINFTNNKAKIIFDKNQIPLSAIIAKIRAIGYDAQGYDPKMLENINAKERKSYYTRMIVGIFCTMNIMWIAVAQYSGYFLGMERDIKDILNLAGFALATPTLFFSGFIFFRSGYFGLKNGFINMDLLVATGATLAYIYSIYAALSHSGETYFESVTMIITFVLIGKFLEITTKKSAGDSIDRLNLSVPTIVSVCESADFERSALKTISPEEVQIGDIIQVKAGEKIAIDGILLSPSATIDSSMLTGESALESKTQNAPLISGSINLERTIFYRATRIFEDSTLNNIINLIQDSITKKPTIETKANAISYHFSAFVLLCAVATFAFWAWSSGSFEKAMIVAVSVIIIACPCALALATPIATIIGITEAYKRKLLFKEARFLESFAKSDCIVFDKTGTLTFGKPKVVGEVKLREYEVLILRDFVLLNTHPISKGIAEFLGESIESNHESKSDFGRKSKSAITDFKQISQKGISAKCGDLELLGGSESFMREYGVRFADLDLMDKSNSSKFYYAINGELVAIFDLKDRLKNGAKEAIAEFQSQGFRVVILSGDRFAVVKSIADSLKIAEFYAEQSPIDKSAFIDKLRAQGHKVVMIGDGINDAIALNKSDIAISMGAGSDVAIESSDIVLLDDSLQSLRLAHKIALKTYATIKQNIKISIIYNLLTIPIAMAGLIIPLFAAISMSFSSILVVLNSLKIKRNAESTMKSLQDSAKI
ncbi:heavy metal translocating P-type ATPase [Helicobacter sp. 23-1045]